MQHFSASFPCLCELFETCKQLFQKGSKIYSIFFQILTHAVCYSFVAVGRSAWLQVVSFPARLITAIINTFTYLVLTVRTVSYGGCSIFFRLIYGPRASRSGHKKTRSVPYSMNLELGLDLELGCRRYISSASCNIHKSHIIFIRASTMRNSLFNPIDLCGVRRFEKWGDNFIILNMFLLHGHCVGTSFLDAWKIYISFSVMRDWSINLTDWPTDQPTSGFLVGNYGSLICVLNGWMDEERKNIRN